MIRKTLATTLVAGAALTGLASTAHAADTAAVTVKRFQACGKGETLKNGTCAKSAKKTMKGAVKFASSTGVNGSAVNKTRAPMDVVVTFYWKTGKVNHKTPPRIFTVKAGKTRTILTGVPANGRMMTKVTVQICQGSKNKRKCGVQKVVRPSLVG